jgi:hypothetical protein
LTRFGRNAEGVRRRNDAPRTPSALRLYGQFLKISKLSLAELTT